jgi:hypothetical protein
MRTERAGVAVMSLARTPEVLVSNPGPDNLIEASHVLPQLFQSNSGIVSQLGHDRFLLNAFQFIIQLLSYHSIPYNLASGIAVKEPTGNKDVSM